MLSTISTPAIAIATDLHAAARVIVAMEDGHGPYVLTGRVAPADAERLFLQHAAAHRPPAAAPGVRGTPCTQPLTRG
jgi:hypothetical protein